MKNAKILLLGFLITAIIFTIYFYLNKATPLPQDTDVVVPSEKSVVLSSETASEEKSESEFPHDLIIPENAVLPKYLRFTHFFFSEPDKIYTEFQQNYIDEFEATEVFSLSSRNSAEYLECYFTLNYLTSKNAHSFFLAAYKQPDSNLYIGDIPSIFEDYSFFVLNSDYENTVKQPIGKFIVALQEDGTTIVSFAYYNKTFVEENELVYFPSGLHYYEPFPITSEVKAMESVGSVVLPDDYSFYNGIWYFRHPIDAKQNPNIINENYLQLKIDANGSFTGTLCQKINSNQSTPNIAEFEGSISDNIGYASYEDDGWGNSGNLYFSFHENGIVVTVVESKITDHYGFCGGKNYYSK